MTDIRAWCRIDDLDIKLEGSPEAVWELLNKLTDKLGIKPTTSFVAQIEDGSSYTSLATTSEIITGELVEESRAKPSLFDFFLTIQPQNQTEEVMLITYHLERNPGDGAFRFG
jgi:hypothetical protein